MTRLEAETSGAVADRLDLGAGELAHGFHRLLLFAVLLVERPETEDREQKRDREGERRHRRFSL